MGRSLNLDVAGWAAIISTESVEDFGATEAASAVPAAMRRRLPPFTRDVLRCALPLLRDQPHCPLILSSPHGDLHSTVTLLSDIARREILSPSLFGLSVHNAPIGALSLCLTEPGDQTALAGGAASLAAGLTEAYARLATSDVPAVVLVHAEDRLPPIYAEMDDDTPGVYLALSLRLCDGEEGGVEVVPHRAGAVALAHALAAGQKRLTFSPPRAEAIAA